LIGSTVPWTHWRQLSYVLTYGYLALVVGVTWAVIVWLERWTGRELEELPKGVRALP